MNTGNVLQTFKPKTEVYRFCLDVSRTKCIIGESSKIVTLPTGIKGYFTLTPEFNSKEGSKKLQPSN